MIRIVLLALLASCSSNVNAFLQFVNSPTLSFHRENDIFSSRNDDSSTMPLYASGKTTEKPLYDGTNYTFPDTTKPSGVAEIVEVTFVNACMQLREGYVDVLKLFIAAAVAGYEFGYPIDEIQKELANCKNQSANRPLMDEEVNLRNTWYCLVYLTLVSLGHPSRGASSSSSSVLVDSIPSDIRNDYQEVVEQAVASNNKGLSPSAEELLKQSKKSDLSVMEQAIYSQSLRLIALVFTVLRESEEAREEQSPPTPPIEGAY